MARALVVYESMFGNSEQVARAVAAGAGEVMSVDLREVTTAPTELGGYDVGVIGGPTHAFTMSRPSTRREAREQGAARGAVGTGLREWLAALPAHSHGGWFAAFDTRVGTVRHLPGSAARSAARAARRHGLQELVEPNSFLVEGVGGPLLDGELERAHAWGHLVAATAPVPA